MHVVSSQQHRPPRPGALAVVAALLLTAGAAAQEDGTDVDSGEAEVAQACLDHPTIRRTRIINDRNIAFFLRGGTIYLNQLPRQCPSLRRNSLVNYAIENRSVCAGSLFQVMWEAGTGNFVPSFVCRLGAFVPVTAEQLEDLEILTTEERRGSRRHNPSQAVTTEQVELPPPEPAADEPSPK
jgi:hypothetical protein